MKGTETMVSIYRASIACIVLALLSACGGQAAAPQPTSAPAAIASTSVPTNAPAVAATSAPTSPPAAASQSTSAPSTGATFPVTIDHKYGSTTIKELPKRVVTVGLTDHDALLALDVVPVGTFEWFGKYPSSVWPWAQDKLKGAKPENVGEGDTIKYETIAALKPDVILALYSGITQEQYGLLTKIAPTVAQPAGYVDYGIPWQELTHKIGQVVGQVERADAMVKEVEDSIAQVRTAHPEFAGATALVATPYEGIWVYGPEDVRGRFLTSLGFKLPADLAKVTGAAFGGNLSLERADLLDVDAIVWLDPSEAKGPLGGPLYSNFKVHTQGREVMLDSYKTPLGGATSFVSVLSLPFLLDGIVPMLSAAVDGNPNTKVELKTP